MIVARRSLGRRVFAVLLGLAAGVGLSLASGKAEACTMVIGESGNSWTITGSSSSVPASSFIRSTSGQCHFRVYNNSGYAGSNVIIGTNLAERIRAGIDGVRYRDDGGGDTWRIRSIQFLPYNNAPSICYLRIGASGVRMTYSTAIGIPGSLGQGAFNAVPAMEKVDWYTCNTGGEHRARIYNDQNYGWPLWDTVPFTGTTKTLPFRSRSMELW